MSTFQFHHVALTVRDLSESLRFYERFGFREVLRYEDPAGKFEVSHLKLGEAYLELWWCRNQVAPPRSASTLETDLPRVGWKHLALRVDSVDRVKPLLEEWQVPIEVQPRDGNTGVRYLFVKDPSGNLLEVLEDNRDL